MRRSRQHRSLRQRSRQGDTYRVYQTPEGCSGERYQRHGGCGVEHAAQSAALFGVPLSLPCMALRHQLASAASQVGGAQGLKGRRSCMEGRTKRHPVHNFSTHTNASFQVSFLMLFTAGLMSSYMHVFRTASLCNGLSDEGTCQCKNTWDASAIAVVSSTARMGCPKRSPTDLIRQTCTLRNAGQRVAAANCGVEHWLTVWHKLCDTSLEVAADPNCSVLAGGVRHRATKQ